MNIQEAASSMKVVNHNLQIGTVQVNSCEDMIVLDDWLDGVQEDINYLTEALRKGNDSHTTVMALKLQKVLLQQIKNRQKYLHDFYQPKIDYFKTNYPNEFNN